MLIAFLVVVVFVVHTIVKAKTIDVTAGTSGDDMSVVKGDYKVLDEV